MNHVRRSWTSSGRASLQVVRNPRLRGGTVEVSSRGSKLLASASGSSEPEEIVRIHESNELEDYPTSENVASVPLPFYSPESDEWPMDYFGESTRGDLLPSENFLKPEMIMSKDEIINICQDLGLDRVSCNIRHPLSSCSSALATNVHHALILFASAPYSACPDVTCCISSLFLAVGYT